MSKNFLDIRAAMNAPYDAIAHLEKLHPELTEENSELRKHILDELRNVHDDFSLLLCLVRARMGQLVQWIEYQDYLHRPDNAELRNKLAERLHDGPVGYAELAKEARSAFERIFDETRCNYECKGMYFCHLDKNHPGAEDDENSHRYW